MLDFKEYEDRAELYIYGTIESASWDDDAITVNAVKESLDSIDNEKPLTIYINSDGGEINAGIAISHIIQRYKGPTKAVIDGWACSVASVIFFSADECVVPEDSYLMIHKPWVLTYGDAEELRTQANTLDVLQAGIETVYRKAAKEGVTEEIIHEMVEKETWFNGVEAEKYFNVIVGDASHAMARTGDTFKMFKNIPKNIKTVSSKKGDNEKMISKVDSILEYVSNLEV